jgi:hypothetical protein
LLARRPARFDALPRIEKLSEHLLALMGIRLESRALGNIQPG